MCFCVTNSLRPMQLMLSLIRLREVVLSIHDSDDCLLYDPLNQNTGANIGLCFL